MPLSRRAFLTAAVTAAAGSRRAAHAAPAAAHTRLILLGTGGGPRPRKASSAAAQVVVANDVAYVIDCGGLGTRVEAWGPPPLERMTKLFFEMNEYDIQVRMSNEGRTALVPLVQVHELREGGAVLSDENVRVTCALVDHPPVVPAFAYRFDARDRSIVISGDTAPARNLVKLAGGADVLVHSAMYPPAIDRLVARVPNAAALKASILAHQTSAEDAGRLAREAGVKTLVLSHLVPPDDPELTEAMWLEAARRQFGGKVIVGRDLLEV